MSMIRIVGFSYMAFIMLRPIPTKYTFLRVLSWTNVYFNFAEWFCYIYWDDHKIFLSLFFFMWYITLIDFQVLNHSYISGINPTWLWWMNLLMYCWIQFANILRIIFASIFIKDVGCSFLFCIVFIWVWYQSNAGLIYLKYFLLFFGVFGE